MPSRPMLSTPARSETISPSAANRRGTPARLPPAMSAVRKLWVRRSLNPAPRRGCALAAHVGLVGRSRLALSSDRRRQIALAHVAAAPEQLGDAHEEQDEADQDEGELIREAGLLGGEVAADREEGEQEDERDDRKGVHPGQEAERHHQEA